MRKSRFLSSGLVAMCLCLCVSACGSRYGEIEQLAQQELNRCKELYVIALQTGRVKLPKGGQNPHVTHPATGGVETPMSQVWLVNGGYMGEVYECRGCDSCMTCYQQAGLIDYQVESIEQDSVIARVRLTEKGAQCLVENYLEEPHPILNAWRRREQIEMVVVAQEKFEVEVHPTDTTGVYVGKAHRSLVLTPFLEVLGGTVNDQFRDYFYTFRLDVRNPQCPRMKDRTIHALSE